jgi:hypothetical protein
MLINTAYLKVDRQLIYCMLFSNVAHRASLVAGLGSMPGRKGVWPMKENFKRSVNNISHKSQCLDLQCGNMFSYIFLS